MRTTGRAWIALAGVLAATAVVGYVAAASALLRPGFPLDDAWIHQTYARNLALRGEWALVPGETSGGSTAPLWTGLLAVGARAGIAPVPWAAGLGAVALIAGAALTFARLRDRAHIPRIVAIAAAITFAIEWHLVWAAASGMEVILVVTLVAAVLWVHERPVAPALAGALVGVGVWLRPDAVSLILIPLAGIAFRGNENLRARRRGVLMLMVGLAALVGPYLLFNLATAGEIWPSTLFAKQAEYAVVRDLPVAQRLLRVFGAPLPGAGVVLLPGVIWRLFTLARRRDWAGMAPLAWAAAHLLAFTFRLPVVYQHGRYQMPVIPVLVVLGWEGIAVAGDAARGIGRTVVRAWGGAVVAVGLAFLLLGGRAYAQDVALIETEMVDTARWVAAETEPAELVAAHDIGALGYFGGRRILDLAGLADPEVIPILRDERALARFLDARGAAYLVTFPSWYPGLTACATPVHTASGRFSVPQGGERMTVYRWPGSGGARPQTCMLYSP